MRQDGTSKEKKEKTLRFAGPPDRDSIPAQQSKVFITCFSSGPHAPVLAHSACRVTNHAICSISWLVPCTAENTLVPEHTDSEVGSTMQVQERADCTGMTPQQNASGTEKKDRTPHVRFCTPAAEPTKIPKTPVHSRSSNAGEQDAVLIPNVPRPH